MLAGLSGCPLAHVGTQAHPRCPCSINTRLQSHGQRAGQIGEVKVEQPRGRVLPKHCSGQSAASASSCATLPRLQQPRSLLTRLTLSDWVPSGQQSSSHAQYVRVGGRAWLGVRLALVGGRRLLGHGQDFASHHLEHGLVNDAALAEPLHSLPCQIDEDTTNLADGCIGR